jgi:hypothetical protein
MHGKAEQRLVLSVRMSCPLPSDIAGIQPALPSGGTSAPADVVPENWSWLGGDGGERLCGTVWHAPILYSIFLRAADEASLAAVADERRQSMPCNGWMLVFDAVPRRSERVQLGHSYLLDGPKPLIARVSSNNFHVWERRRGLA